MTLYPLTIYLNLISVISKSIEFFTILTTSGWGAIGRHGKFISEFLYLRIYILPRVHDGKYILIGQWNLTAQSRVGSQKYG